MKQLLTMLFFVWSLWGEGNLTVEVASHETNATTKPFSMWENIEFDYELDAYYTNVSLTIPLTDRTMENYRTKTELELYTHLLLHAIPPSFLVLELSYNPLPNLGVYLKNQQRNFYDSATILGGSVNIVDSATVGFEEPYAMTLFLGNTVKFTQSDEDIAVGNRAYAGFIVSVSDGHIKDNILIYDPSIETEWKVIGKRSFKDYKLSYSYRVGLKYHQHPEIVSSYYVGFRRSRLDFQTDMLSIINNSAIDVKATFRLGSVEPIAFLAIVEKKFPVVLWGQPLGLSFGVGYAYMSDNKYTGLLKEEGVETHRLIIRPNIQF
ncbi:MAG: hypothetical protein KU37_02780 [Sulfuricurvum sp. PC08-66]|nr:MAG: hypothetical protein KU37_02780 [Sulfuricurvum sp. PC08-66]